MDNNGHGGTFLFGFIVGAISGAVAGFLMTPRSGDQLRADIATRTSEAQQRLKETTSSARAQTQGLLEQYVVTARQLTDDVRARSEELVNQYTGAAIKEAERLQETGQETVTDQGPGEQVRDASLAAAEAAAEAVEEEARESKEAAQRARENDGTPPATSS